MAERSIITHSYKIETSWRSGGVSIIPAEKGVHKVYLDQVHEDQIAVIDSIPSSHAQIVSKTDGAITTIPNIELSVMTADCIGVLAWDTAKHVVGLCHAGYRGLLSGIVPKLITEMRKHASGEIRVQTSPCIDICCYNISDAHDRINQVIEKFGTKAIIEKEGQKFLSMRHCLMKEFKAGGVQQENISINSLCTCCEDLPSHYRTKYIHKKSQRKHSLRTTIMIQEHDGKIQQ